MWIKVLEFAGMTYLKVDEMSIYLGSMKSTYRKFKAELGSFGSRITKLSKRMQ